ncbi:MAG: HIT family protein [Candidatus Nanoarchaeia archaeon]
MKDCIFCKLVNGEIPSRKVYEDNFVLSFFPKEPEAKGHILVIPKKHYENIFEISNEDLKRLILVVKKLSNNVKSSLGASGINILHASGKDAGQSMFHFHIHLIPRFKDDGLDAWMKQTNTGPFDLDDLQNKILNGDRR